MLGFEAGFENEANLKRDISEEVQLHKTFLQGLKGKFPSILIQSKGSESECRPGRQWENTPGEKKGNQHSLKGV